MKSFVMTQKTIANCPFYILVPEHWRKNGTCKCDDAKHQRMMVEEWEYTPADFVNTRFGWLGDKNE